jgi:parallel beta-helix repeat protein
MKSSRIPFVLFIPWVLACLLLALSLGVLSARVRAGPPPGLPPVQSAPTVMPMQIIVVPDDYPTIQEAVDHAGPGEQVLVQSGTYTENVQVRTPVNLVGAGREHTTVDADGGPYAISILTAGVRIAQLAVRGGDVGIAIAPAPVSDNTIEDCKVQDNVYGISIQQSGAPGGPGNLIRNCRFVNNDQAGVHLLGSYHNRIENSTFSDSIRNIYLENSSYNVITGAVLTATLNHYAGILIQTTTPSSRATHNLVAGCTVSGHHYGIHIKDADDNTVEDCTLFDNTWNGINLYGGSTRNTVRDCFIYGDSDTGIDISGQAYGNHVERCTVTGMRTDALYLFDTWDNTIDDLYVYDVPQYGILIGELGQPTGTYSNTISNCRIENTFRGINAWYNVTHNIIQGCEISGSLHQGINLEIGVNDNQIRNCRIQNSGIGDVRFNASYGNSMWDSRAESLGAEVGSTGRLIDSYVDSIPFVDGIISVEWRLKTKVTNRLSPVAGAQVQVYRNPTPTLVAENLTNADGRVTFILPEKILRSDHQEEWLADYLVVASDQVSETSATLVLRSPQILHLDLAGPLSSVYLPIVMRE